MDKRSNIYPIVETEEFSLCCEAIILTVSAGKRICLECRKDIEDESGTKS